VGTGHGGGSKIAIWEPGKRFAKVERLAAYGSQPEPGSQPQQIMVDYHIKSAGGKTLLRLVHSGFGRGAGWDSEFEGTRKGWPIFLWMLKHGLERHPGVDSKTVSVIVPRQVSADEAWSRLVPAGLKPWCAPAILPKCLAGTSKNSTML
jgi:hypothetical protein